MSYETPIAMGGKIVYTDYAVQAKRFFAFTQRDHDVTHNRILRAHRARFVKPLAWTAVVSTRRARCVYGGIMKIMDQLNWKEPGSNIDFVRMFGIAVNLFPDRDSGAVLMIDHGHLLTAEEWTELKAAIDQFYEENVPGFAEQLNEEAERRRKSAEEAKATDGAPREHNARPGFVYVLEGNGLYKIGKTNRKIADERLLDFTPQLPFETEIVCVIKSNNASVLESELHQQFSDKRMRGEWFNLTGEDVEYLKELAQ